MAISDKKQRILCSDNDKDGHLGEADYDSTEYLAFSLMTSQGPAIRVI